ncbi:hypothetical protein YS110_20350 [Acidovorax sp. YS12]|nr:hypothetical protein YS110_20350 [Acidovorax sp. YS12]
MGRTAHAAALPRRLVEAGLLALAAALVWMGAQRPSILVVHSQSERIPWTRGIDAGIDRAMQQAGAVRLERIYLQGRDAQRTQAQIAETLGFIGRWEPDVVMVVDDLAQARVGAAYLGALQPLIVYSGIEDHARTLAHSQRPQVQGIAERTPWPMVESSLLRLAPPGAARKPRIALVSDTGPAAEEEARGFLAHGWKAAQPIGVWRCASLEQWLRALDEIATQADLVVIGDYRYLPVPAGRTAPSWRMQLAQAALERLPQPLSALSGYAVMDGIPMGILPSPVEQGEVATQLALQAATAPEAFAAPAAARHLLTRNFALLVNPAQMQRRHMHLDALDTYYARISRRFIAPHAAP